ncbi:MAG: hypothetical protein L0177_02955, partial [Chloroflexi bacterium]|nr:hypothetical protein [Chloroflexota bacterium]
KFSGETLRASRDFVSVYLRKIPSISEHPDFFGVRRQESGIRGWGDMVAFIAFFIGSLPNIYMSHRCSFGPEPR